MSSKLKDIAPDIAAHLNDAEIEELIGPKEVPTAPMPPTAPTPPTKEQVREAVRLLRWVGADHVPASAGLAAPKLKKNPNDPHEVVEVVEIDEQALGISGIARKTGLDRAYVKKLYTEVQKLKK